MTYQQRTISLLTNTQRDTAIAAIHNAPVGQNLEVVIREVKKQRSIDQQALLFAGPLKDISEQAWVDGHQFSKDAWHYHYKTLYLPEFEDPYIFELVKDCEKYIKWEFTPKGERLLVGSTTQLTKYGYSQYLEKIHADGAGMGVLFTTKER
ncbi:MAG: recombination protein NinB [Pseudomonadota bacterium]